MTEELSVEERAAIMGHVSQEDFKGDPDKWVPAEKWIERTEQLFPITKATVKKLTEDVAGFKGENSALIQEIASLKTTLKEFAEFSKKAEERAFNKALKELEDRQRAAVAEGDVEAFDQVKSELDDLKQHPALTGIATAPAPIIPVVEKTWPEVSKPEVFHEWMGENEWYKKSPKMAAYAHQMDMYLKNTEVMPTQRAQLDKVTELVKEEFPQYWANDKKAAPQSVEGGGDVGGNSGGRGKKTYSDLPADAKRYCDEWSGKDGKGTGTIPGFTRQQYLDQYQWDK
jgi:hypothetical protein